MSVLCLLAAAFRREASRTGLQPALLRAALTSVSICRAGDAAAVAIGGATRTSAGATPGTARKAATSRGVPRTRAARMDLLGRSRGAIRSVSGGGSGFRGVAADLLERHEASGARRSTQGVTARRNRSLRERLRRHDDRPA